MDRRLCRVGCQLPARCVSATCHRHHLPPSTRSSTRTATSRCCLWCKNVPRKLVLTARLTESDRVRPAWTRQCEHVRSMLSGPGEKRRPAEPPTTRYLVSLLTHSAGHQVSSGTKDAGSCMCHHNVLYNYGVPLHTQIRDAKAQCIRPRLLLGAPMPPSAHTGWDIGDR